MIGGIELRVMVRRQRTASGAVWPRSLEGGDWREASRIRRGQKAYWKILLFLKPEVQTEYKVRNKYGEGFRCDEGYEVYG